MTASDYILQQDTGRQRVLSSINTIIMEEDNNVTQEIGLMMSKKMIIYKEKGCFKYGLASVKNYMSIHAMPVYIDSTLHAKYRELLPAAQFQKGCINFKYPDDVPLEIMRQLVADCAKLSMLTMLEKRRNNA